MKRNVEVLRPGRCGHLIGFRSIFEFSGLEREAGKAEDVSSRRGAFKEVSITWPFLPLPQFPPSATARMEKPSTHPKIRPESVHDSFASLTPPALTTEQERKTWRKVDLRLMPMLALLYLFSFLDRGTSRVHGFPSRTSYPTT